MRTAYVDADGQVMAVYENCETNSAVWEENGCERVEVPGDIGVVTRDHKLGVSEGVATAKERSKNPVQPEGTASLREAVATALEAGDITEREALLHFLKGTRP